MSSSRRQIYGWAKLSKKKAHSSNGLDLVLLFDWATIFSPLFEALTDNSLSYLNKRTSVDKKNIIHITTHSTSLFIRHKNHKFALYTLTNVIC